MARRSLDVTLAFFMNTYIIIIIVISHALGVIFPDGLSSW